MKFAHTLRIRGASNMPHPEVKPWSQYGYSQSMARMRSAYTVAARRHHSSSLICHTTCATCRCNHTSAGIRHLIDPHPRATNELGKACALLCEAFFRGAKAYPCLATQSHPCQHAGSERLDARRLRIPPLISQSHELLLHPFS
jgi:hypothetical protein